MTTVASPESDRGGLDREMLGECGRLDLGQLRLWIQFRHRGREHEIRTCVAARFHVLFHEPRVAVQVFFPIELSGVDENAGDDGVRLLARDFQQLPVTAVHCSHGRDQADHLSGEAQRSQTFGALNKFLKL